MQQHQDQGVWHISRFNVCEEGGIWTKYFNTALDKGAQISAQTKDVVSTSTVHCLVLYYPLSQQFSSSWSPILYEFESSNQEETERGVSDRVVGGVSVREQGR